MVYQPIYDYSIYIYTASKVLQHRILRNINTKVYFKGYFKFFHE